MLSPRGASTKYTLPLRATLPPSERPNWPPSVIVSELPLTTIRPGTQIATRLAPACTAIALLFVALGHVGAPETWRAWTTKPGPVCAKRKSPDAWKSYSKPLNVVKCVSPMVVAAAQFDGDPPALLSVANSAGPKPETAGGLGPKLRLFISAVKPFAVQIGAFLPP